MSRQGLDYEAITRFVDTSSQSQAITYSSCNQTELYCIEQGLGQLNAVATFQIGLLYARKVL
jgi:hypothetical protein